MCVCGGGGQGGAHSLDMVLWLLKGQGLVAVGSPLIGVGLPLVGVDSPTRTTTTITTTTISSSSSSGGSHASAT